jgi:TIR domain-containing protein
MTVFISWSGPLAQAVAEQLDSWLPSVIQSVKTWISSNDIEKGSIWSAELNDALSTSVGIVCVTQENKEAPWLLFEAGALSKGLTKARVCPLLIDLEKRELQPPLSHFSLTVPDAADMLKLLKTINAADQELALPEARLEKAFAIFWPEFDKKLKEIKQTCKPSGQAAPKRPIDDMVSEILDNTRALYRNLEAQQFTSPGISGYSGGSPAVNPWKSALTDPFDLEAKRPSPGILKKAIEIYLGSIEPKKEGGKSSPPKSS